MASDSNLSAVRQEAGLGTFATQPNRCHGGLPSLTPATATLALAGDPDLPSRTNRGTKKICTRTITQAIDIHTSCVTNPSRTEIVKSEATTRNRGQDVDFASTLA